VEEIKVSRRRDVAIVTIDRPEKRNACTLAMWQELGRVFEELAADTTARVVILTGAGGQFCAGADISEFGSVRNDAASAGVYAEANDGAEHALSHMPKPTIAAIDGFAMGGGCGLALCCDFRVAAADARMGIPAAKLGIVYSPESCRALYDAVGLSNAKRILFTGGRFTAEEAARMGLVDILAEGPALPAALAFAAEMSGNAPLSLAGAKTVLNAIADGSVNARLDEFAALRAAAADSEDYAEGRRAFVEKRAPGFVGR